MAWLVRHWNYQAQTKTFVLGFVLVFVFAQERPMRSFRFFGKNQYFTVISESQLPLCGFFCGKCHVHFSIAPAVAC